MGINFSELLICYVSGQNRKATGKEMKVLALGNQVACTWMRHPKNDLTQLLLTMITFPY